MPYSPKLVLEMSTVGKIGTKRVKSVRQQFNIRLNTQLLNELEATTIKLNELYPYDGWTKTKIVVMGLQAILPKFSLEMESGK